MTLMNHEELLLNLEDNEWPLTTIDHDRQIARAIVVDDDENFYFVRANRDDDFGKATLIETAGGGVEEGEDLAEYEKCRCTSLGRLVANREIPVLKRAKDLLEDFNNLFFL